MTLALNRVVNRVTRRVHSSRVISTSVLPQIEIPASVPRIVYYNAEFQSDIAHTLGDVSQWNDREANAEHLLQGVAANQPVTLDPIRKIGGKNALYFKGGSNAVASFMIASALVDDRINEWFFVMRWYDDQPGNINGILSNNGDRGNIRTNSQFNDEVRYHNTAVIAGAAGDANDFGHTDGLWNPDDITGSITDHLHLDTYDETPRRYHCTRGSTIGDDANVYDNLRVGGDGVGGGRHGRFDLACLVGCPTLTAAQRTAMRTWMKANWSLIH